MSGQFVISLDLELLWGVRDHADQSTYGKNILGGRAAVPKILSLFKKYNISATWATVGFLFCETKEELIHYIPESKPNYHKIKLSNFEYIDEIGKNETDDPFYFGTSLINQILDSEGQEIGTHTLSHYYALEAGSCERSFLSDIKICCQIAENKSINLRSIVFPRNQFSAGHLKICSEFGIKYYRGVPGGYPYVSAPGKIQNSLGRRALRLADAYTGILGPHHHKIEPQKGAEKGSWNVPASHFLRPSAGFSGKAHALHIHLIKRSMAAAAKSGRQYHLWWHPHNFGIETERNLMGLEELLKHFEYLKDTYGMESKSMAETECLS